MDKIEAIGAAIHQGLIGKVPGSQADFVPSAPVAPAPIPHDAAAQNALVLKRMQAQIEQLQARLLEGAKATLTPAPGGCVPAAARFWAGDVLAEFAPVQPAPTPYTVIANRVFSGEELIASVVGESDKERAATAEFIGRACNAHQTLADLLDHALAHIGWLENRLAPVPEKVAAAPAPFSVEYARKRMAEALK